MKDGAVLVIGAGISGLAAAWMLGHAGCPVTILEARKRIGGRIFTLRDPDLDFPVELGAEFIHGKAPEIFDPLRGAGVKITEVEGRPWCITDRQLRPCDFFSRVDSVLEKMDDSAPDESFSVFLKRVFPDPRRDSQTQQRALGYVSGFNAADPDLVSVHWLVHGMRAEEKIQGHRGFRSNNGYQDLLDEFQKRIAGLPEVEIRTETIVQSIQWREGHAEVQTQNLQAGRAETCTAPRVLVTQPLALLKARSDELGAIQFSPSLPREKTAAMKKLEMGKVIRVVLRFRERFWNTIAPSTHEPGALADMSFLFSGDEWFPTWWTTMPNQSPILTAWAPFHCAERLSGQPDSSIIEQSLLTLSALLQFDLGKLEKLLLRGYLHNWQADPFSRGAYSYGKVGCDGAHEAFARPIANTLFFAGEATDVSGNNGTVHGAIASGYRAAREILQIHS